MCIERAIVLNAKWAIFQLYHGMNKLHFDQMMMSAFYKTNTPSWILIVQAHWNNSPGKDMLPHSWHIILIPSQPVFALSPSCCVLRGEATNTDSVFGFTRLGLEPMIYLTWGEHPNHYTTDTVITNYLSIVTKTPQRIKKPLPCFQ